MTFVFPKASGRSHFRNQTHMHELQRDKSGFPEGIGYCYYQMPKNQFHGVKQSLVCMAVKFVIASKAIPIIPLIFFVPDICFSKNKWRVTLSKSFLYARVLKQNDKSF